MTINLSIIIPTYNGAAKLPNILKALQQQSDQDFELIIVVDGSTDNSMEVLAQYNKNFGQIKIIYQSNGGRSVSRNRGVAEASGAYLLFFDDDMRPSPNVVAQHKAHIAQYPNAILVGAQIEDWEAIQNDVQRYKGTLSRKWSEQTYQTTTQGLLGKEAVYLTAAHFSIAKAVFEQLGSFDENLTDSEDFDLAVRAVNANIAIYFRPDILAWHDDFITCQSYIKRQREYLASHQKLRQLKPDLYKDFPQHLPKPLTFPKKQVYQFFAQPYWVRTIDGQNWLKYLPQAIRYRIYDWVITGLGVHFREKEIKR